MQCYGYCVNSNSLLPFADKGQLLDSFKGL